MSGNYGAGGESQTVERSLSFINGNTDTSLLGEADIADYLTVCFCHNETLDKVTDIELVLNLRLREDVLIMKCLGRRICSGCGTNYNVAKIDVGGEDGGKRIFMPPLLPPPACATKLTIRADDTEEVVRARLNVYVEECKPVEEYYREQGKLLDFDVIGGIPETWPKLLDAVKSHMPEESLSVAAA